MILHLIIVQPLMAIGQHQDTYKVLREATEQRTGNGSVIGMLHDSVIKVNWEITVL